MRLKQFSALLPKAAEIRKTLKAKQRELGRLNDEVLELEGYADALVGVLDYAGHPIMVVELDGQTSVYSAAEDVERQAFVIPNGEAYDVIALRKEDTPAHALGTHPTVRTAIKAAKSFVAGEVKLAQGRPRAAAKAAP